MTEDMKMKATNLWRVNFSGPRRPSQKVSGEHAFHLMLQTCAACHARYRERDSFPKADDLLPVVYIQQLETAYAAPTAAQTVGLDQELALE